MNAKSDLRVCKNKNCQKILPEGYKHKYCEACRNQHAQTAKNVLKGIGAGVATAASVVVVVVTGGRINPKKCYIRHNYGLIRFIKCNYFSA